LSTNALAAAPYVTAALGAGGVAVLASRRRELIERWLVWCATAGLVGLAVLLGVAGLAVLASVLGVVGAAEYARLRRLPRSDAAALCLVLAALPWLAVTLPDRWSQLWLLLPLVAALPAIWQGDVVRGGDRLVSTAFGAVWLSALVGLVVVDARVVISVVVAVSVADVAAWASGKAIGGPLLTPVSPNKTLAGLVGGGTVGVLVLWGLGALSLSTVLAVVLAAPMGDLLESLLKRSAGVKDAGRWLPGFGGLLDRIDSLLPALAVLVALS
jgi:phosphatidate cytidylyltransferase